MPKPRKPLTTDYKYLKMFVTTELKIGVAAEIINSLLSKEMQDKFNKAVVDLDNEVNAFAGDDFFDYPNSTGVSNQLYAKGTAVTDKYIPRSPEKEQQILDKYKALIDVFKEIKEDPEIQKHPSAKTIVDNHINLGERALNGRDVNSEKMLAPGRDWLQAIAVDMVSNYTAENGENKHISVDEFDQIFTDMKFAEMNDLTLKHTDLINELQTKPVSSARRAEITKEIKEICKSLVEDAKNLTSPETEQKIRHAFVDYDVNVKGNRGAGFIVGEKAQKELELLEAGWDPAYVNDYSLINNVSNTVKRISDFSEKYPNIQELKTLDEPIKKIIALDPTKKVFDSQTDFIKSYQEYSNALNEFKTEFNKPEVKNVFESLNDVYDEAVDKRIENPEYPYGVTHQDFKAFDIKKSIMLSTSNHAEDPVFYQQLEELADKANFKGKGIEVVNEYGDVTYSEEPGKKMAEAAYNLNNITEGIYANVMQFGTRARNENISEGASGDLKFLLSRIGKYPENNIKGQLNYADTEKNLNMFIKKADAFEASDEPKTAEQKKFVKDIKKFAQDSLKTMAEAKPEGLRESKPFTEIINDIEENRDAERSYALNAPKSPSALNVDRSHLKILPNPVATNYEMLKQILGDNFISEKDYMSQAMLTTGTGYIASSNEKSTSLDNYAVDAGSDNYTKTLIANTPEMIKKANEDTKKIADTLNTVTEGLKVKNLPGLYSYFNFANNMAQNVLKGENDVVELKHIPGAYGYMGSADWRVPKNIKKEDAPKAFNDMLVGMQYDKLYDTVGKRIELKKELKDAIVTPEQRKEYVKKLKESNDKIIGILEHQMSDESEQKYSQFFQNYSDTIKGTRGNHSVINNLKARNKALDNGWDPTRIDDYSVIKKFVGNCKDTNVIFDEIKNPKFEKLNNVTKKIASLDPDKMVFKNQLEYDRYVLEVSKLTKDFIAESKKPGMAEEIRKVLNASDKADDEWTAYNDERKKELTASKTDTNVIVRPKKERPALVSNIHMLKTLVSDNNVDKIKYKCLANDLDLTHRSFKGDPLKVTEREKAVGAAIRFSGVDRARKSIMSISDFAEEKLRRMETELDKMKKVPSKEYTEMKLALIHVAAASKGENGVNSTMHALDELNEKASAYYKKSGFIGNSRTAFSEELKIMSQSCKKKLSEASRGLSAKDKDRSIADLEKNINTQAGTLSSLRMKQLLDNRNKRANGFTDKVKQSLESMKEHIDFFKADAAGRNIGTKGHEEYRELTEAIKIYDMDLSNMKPEEIFNAYTRLLNATDVYAKEHDGMFSGNIGKGRERFDHSVSMRDKMNADLSQVAKSYYTLQKFGKNNTMAQQINANNERLADFAAAAGEEEAKLKARQNANAPVQENAPVQPQPEVRQAPIQEAPVIEQPRQPAPKAQPKANAKLKKYTFPKNELKESDEYRFGSVYDYQVDIKNTINNKVPKNEEQFDDMKSDVFFNVRTIIATNALFPEVADDPERNLLKECAGADGMEKYDAEVAKLTERGKRRDEMRDKLRNDKAFKFMEDKVKTWDDLTKIVDIALTGTGKGLTLEYMKAKNELGKLEENLGERESVKSLNHNKEMNNSNLHT